MCNMMKNKKNGLFKKVCMILPFYLLTFLPLSAQTFTQRIQRSVQGQGSVTIHHDKSIDDLINGSNSGTVTPPKKSTPNVEKSTAATTPEAKRPEVKKDVPKKVTSSPSESSDTLSSAKKTTGHSYKTVGYRIQVFAGGNSRKDRQTAERIGNELRTLFPQEAVYVHFYSPRWICRMGNYRTQEEAHQSLQEIKKLGYTAATIVKGKITVQY